MMKYLLLILMIGFVACKNTPISKEPKNQIMAVLMEQQSAWNKGDIELYMKGYYKSDSLRFASGGHVTYGWETTLNRYKKGYPDKKTMGTLQFSEIDIKLLSENAAMVFGKWELDREHDHPWGLFTLIFKKTDCGWRIIHDHTSAAK
jgi:ketosteroid isomerase-like protein